MKKEGEGRRRKKEEWGDFPLRIEVVKRIEQSEGNGEGGKREREAVGWPFDCLEFVAFSDWSIKKREEKKKEKKKRKDGEDPVMKQISPVL